MNILVTGCSRGVGLEICRVLLEQGNTVYGVARSYTDEFKELEVEYAGRLFFKCVDLSDSKGVRKTIFKEFVGNGVQLDSYVNNAAMAYDDIVTNLNLDRLKAMYDVNDDQVCHPKHVTSSYKGKYCAYFKYIGTHWLQRLGNVCFIKGCSRSILKRHSSRVGTTRSPQHCSCARLHGNQDEQRFDRRPERPNLQAHFTEGSHLSSFSSRDCSFPCKR